MTFILLAVRYCLPLGTVAESIAGVLADRGIDGSGRTIQRWVKKLGRTPRLSSRGCQQLSGWTPGRSETPTDLRRVASVVWWLEPVQRHHGCQTIGLASVA